MRRSDMPSPRLRFQSHHGVNSVWVKAIFGDKYNPDEAPAVLMPTADHQATFGVFNRARAEIASQQGVSVGQIDWTQVSPGTMWGISEDQFAVAGTPQPAIDEYFKQFNMYLERLR